VKVGDDSLGCDYCGDVYRGDFVYYSFDFTRVDIGPHGVRRHDSVELSADLCDKCMELFRKRLLDVDGVVKQHPFRCDVTGADVKDDGAFYLCKVSRVVVNMENQPFRCEKCGKQRRPEDGPCDCGPDSLKLVKEAKVDVDADYVELNFSLDAFGQFRDHIDRVRQGERSWVAQ